MSLTNASQNKLVILAHNFRNLKTLEDVDKAIKKDIFDVFGGEGSVKKIVDKPTGAVYYQSNDIAHFIYAEEGTEAGNFYNKKTSEKLFRFVAEQGLEKLPIPEFYPRFKHAMQTTPETFLYNHTDDELPVFLLSSIRPRNCTR